MNKVAWMVVVGSLTSFSIAQFVKESDISPATRKYREYRMMRTEPPFGLAKVKALIAKIKPAKGADEDSRVLATTAWSRLSTPEKFTYCMLHGEVSSQNCDGMPWVVDEEQKIFAHPPDFSGGGEENWSDRQTAFLAKNRREVVRLLRTTIREKGRVGFNLKAAIVQIDAYELIPDLVTAFDRDHKDQDILSVFALLMKDGKYKPFLQSVTYRKFYGPDANYQAYIVGNEENQKLMISRAMGFYHSRVK